MLSPCVFVTFFLNTTAGGYRLSTGSLSCGTSAEPDAALSPKSGTWFLVPLPPKPDQSNIITFDRSEIFAAEPFLTYMKAGRYGEEGARRPHLLGTVTEMEIEFERNVTRELDKQLEAAKAAGNQSEIVRLEQARDAFVADFSTLRSEVINFFSQKGIQVTPGDQSKYLQSYDVLKANQAMALHDLSDSGSSADRIAPGFDATASEMEKLREVLAADVSGRGRKFAFAADQTLVVSTVDQNQSSHDELGHGRDIQTAGYLRLETSPTGPAISVISRSGDYCPSLKSLETVPAYLAERTDWSISMLEEPNDSCSAKLAFAKLM